MLAVLLEFYPEVLTENSPEAWTLRSKMIYLVPLRSWALKSSVTIRVA